MALDARIPASMTNFYVWLNHLSNQVMFWVTTISFAVIQTAKKLARGYYQSERQLWVKDQTIDEVGDQFRLRVVNDNFFFMNLNILDVGFQDSHG